MEDELARAKAYSVYSADESNLLTTEAGLFKSRSRLAEVYRQKIDPDGKAPLPPAIMTGSPFSDARMDAAQVTYVDDHTAEVMVPNRVTYRLALYGGHWFTRLLPTLAESYPSDPPAALRALVNEFQQWTTAADDICNQISAGRLTTAENIAAAINLRFMLITNTAAAAFPPGLSLCLPTMTLPPEL